jgi:hypothetical protein
MVVSLASLPAMPENRSLVVVVVAAVLLVAPLTLLAVREVHTKRHQNLLLPRFI